MTKVKECIFRRNNILTVCKIKPNMSRTKSTHIGRSPVWKLCW